VFSSSLERAERGHGCLLGVSAWRWAVLATILAVGLASAAADGRDDNVRSVAVAVYTKSASPVEDLDVSELTLTEEGRVRNVLGLERDRRPADIALILDSSTTMGAHYRSVLVDAAVKLLTTLGPDAHVAVWTSGVSASKVVDFGTEPETALRALRMVAPGGRNFVLDAIVDASRELGQRAAARRALVVVTYINIEASQGLIQRAHAEMARAGVTPLVTIVKTGGNPEQTWDVETIFERIAHARGGSSTVVLSVLAADKMLGRVAADLSSQYRLRYSSDAEGPSCPAVKINRQGVTVRVGLSQLER
jgi:hypothetical protein